MSNERRFLILCLIVPCFRLSAATALFEVTDGLWEVPGNWSIAAVPGLADSAHVTFEGRTVRITQPGAVCNNLVAGYAAGETGTVCLVTGTLYTASSQNIGRNGWGRFIQEADTTNRSGGSLTVGEGVTAEGLYELRGGSLAAAEGSAWDLNVGYNGRGVLLQTGGVLGDFGSASSSRYLFVGRGSGEGSYRMNGGEVRFTNNTYVSIGHTGTGAFAQSNGMFRMLRVFNVGKENGGQGSFLLAGGTNSSYQFTLGEKAAARGSAVLCGGELTTAVEGLDVGYYGTGTVWQSGGTVTLAKYLFIGRDAGSQGRYLLTGGEIALTNGNNHMYVGEYGNGALLQSNGVIRVRNWFTVSRRTGSSGVYRMAGGALTVQANLQLGEQPGSRARFEIVGTNSVIACNTLTVTTNATLRAELSADGVSAVAVQNQAALAGRLEVAVADKTFDRPVTLIAAGSLSGQFDEVVPVHPLRQVDVTYESGTGKVTLSNFRYFTGTVIGLY
ncbi:MAG: hypothetical protein RBT78_06515 [Kiritimatiellia bacterium]|jgi:T5SS/PEP-CTERM-associated repeat protein|nr:hypothetical protein [Kiritimatiellia bacterium]